MMRVGLPSRRTDGPDDVDADSDTAMRSPREISSEGQGLGALTPSTALAVRKAVGAATDGQGATPRTLDGAGGSPWANLSVDTTLDHGMESTPTAATSSNTSQQSSATQTQALRAGIPAAMAVSSSSAADVDASSNSATSASAAVPAPGVLPERYTADLVHWQSPADLPERRLVVQRIIAMTKNKRLDATLGPAVAAAVVGPPLPPPPPPRPLTGPLAPPSATSTGTTSLTVPMPAPPAPAASDRTPSLAKRIELSLYSRAASFHEYKDLHTLRRRLQSLVSLSFHEAAVTKRALAAAQQQPSHAMPALPTRFGVSRLQLKRPRQELHRDPSCQGSSQSLTIKRRCCRHELTAPWCDHARETLFLLNEDVLRLVFAFLPGTETIACRAINRFAARVLPSCVVTLDVEIHALQRAFAASSSCLQAFAHLERLHVVNRQQPSDAQETGPSLHAWGCAELDISHDNAGERVVQQLADAIERGACRRLTSLRLVSVFTNTCRGNALHVLCAALVKGSCPDLRDLLLGGNGFSDVGTVDVAWLLRVGSLPKLVRLDLRRNYIGESGLKRIMAALAVGRCPQLKYLCMGGNILTDNSVAPVVDVLAQAKCPQMRFLGLEDNFLSARGVHCIIQAAVAGGMMPKLHHVSSDGRADEVPEPAAAMARMATVDATRAA